MKRSWTMLAGSLVILAVAAPAAHAQAGGPPPGGMRGGGARMMEMLLKDITLDDAQKAKVAAIQEKYMKEMPSMTQGERPDSAAMAKRREVQGKQQAEIRALLTGDQQKAFDKNLAEMRDRMSRRG